MSEVGCFIEGHWYKWIGPKTIRPFYWESKGLMDFMLDGKPHLCVSSYNTCFAAFENQTNALNSDGTVHEWNWFESDLIYFRECNEPIFHKIRRVLCLR